MYITARAVIIRDGKMLAFHRKRKGVLGRMLEYYSIPGGQIDPGEEPEQAAIRELQEEMGVEIKTHGLIAHHSGKIFEHYIFSASIVNGEPKFMSDSEEAVEYVNKNNQYEVVWVPLSDISPKNLKFYGMFYEHIIALGNGVKPEEVAKIPSD